MRNAVLKISAAGIAAAWVAGCSMSPGKVPTVGHVADGVYILPATEAQFTCAEFAGGTRYAVRQAFEKVGDGNKQLLMTIVGNAMTLGAGGIPRSFSIGSGERTQGRQELTKALALDDAARANGCAGVDIPALVNERLGAGSLAKVLEQDRPDPVLSILEEEEAFKSRVR